MDALEEALYLNLRPEVFNTDQGSQYTSEAFTSVLIEKDIRISMDGKGACCDNVFVERLWRRVKYEEVYLHAYESMQESKTGIGKWVDYYNSRRKHQTMKTTPDMKYGIVSQLILAA